MTKFLLDSGDPVEYKEISTLCGEHKTELWGSTTNPSLIAKKLTGKKLTQKQAFGLQKELVMEILDIVPGAVSAEVYANHTTTAHDMIDQGLDIASWDKRVVVKLPTTLEGMKARTELRKKGITINNTLVFSQEQVFAITLHEKLMTTKYGPTHSGYPCFISPFVGRLDDKGQNGMSFVRNAIALIEKNFSKDLVWMLVASIRTVEHLQASLDANADLVTVPAKVYRVWFENPKADYNTSEQNLAPIPVWSPTESLLGINSVDQLIEAITSGKLNIAHELTSAGIDRFVADWQEILA